eukprot:31476-Pelagococcus_subviridis.AAC.17
MTYRTSTPHRSTTQSCRSNGSLNPRKFRSLAFGLTVALARVELLPLHHLAPAPLVHRVVNLDHVRHVLLFRPPTLARDSVEEHLLARVLPRRRRVALMLGERVVSFAYRDRGRLAIGRELLALPRRALLVRLRHHVARVDLRRRVLRVRRDGRRRRSAVAVARRARLAARETREEHVRFLALRLRGGRLRPAAEPEHHRGWKRARPRRGPRAVFGVRAARVHL